MSEALTLSTLVAALNLALAALVYLRNPRHWVNRSFSLFAFAVAGWTFSTGLGYQLAGTPAGLFWARCAFLMAGLTVFAMLLFFHVFPFTATLPRSPAISIAAASTATMGLLSLSPWVVVTVLPGLAGPQVTYGNLYPLFAIHVLGCVGYSVLSLIQKTKGASGAERQQLKYLFVALLVPGLFATVTNLLIPLATGSSRLGRYGPLSSFVMIALIAHSIIRHRLMNVRLVLRQSVVVLLAAIVAATSFILVLLAASHLTRTNPNEIPLALHVPLVLLVALLFQPLKHRIQLALDRYLYREQYDYRRVVRTASLTMSRLLDFNSLMDYLVDVVVKTIRPEHLLIYLHSPETSALRLATSRHTLPATSSFQPPSLLEDDDPLVRFLSGHRSPLLALDSRRRTPSPAALSAFRSLRALAAEAAIPIVDNDILIGILLLGPKLSGDAFYTEDIDLLATLVSQASISLKNAHLYRRVVLTNEYLDNILSTMESGVIAVTVEGRITLLNAAAERLTGITRVEPHQHQHHSLPRELAQPLRDTLADGTARPQFELSLRTHERRDIPLVCSTSALRDKDGTILGALIVFSDLTRVKDLEREKSRAARLASFGALASGIAHEIKNPLVAIRTFAELLPERFSEPDFREDFAKVVINEIDRIDDLVDRLRGLAGPSRQSAGAIDLRDPINETLALLRGQLEHTRTSLHRDFRDPAPHVAVEASQLKQLFLNLFLNALEAMGVAGELTVRIHRKNTEVGEWIVTEVSDTGPGIPESIRTNIFDPFFTTKPHGSGLGLAICRGITDAHRGTIRAEPNRGGLGTTITVELPAATTAAVPIEATVLRND